VKTGLKTEANKYIILFILLLNYTSSAQIPLNGFCKYNKFDSEPGYQSILPLNYNNDSYTDLLLFHNSQKNLLLMEGDNTGSFTRQSTITFRHPVSTVRNLSITGGYSRSYIAVSRKNRTASVFNFNEDGRLFILDEIKFNSYPERIDIGDVALDQSPDVLVSGSSFDGISILHIKSGKITETKAVKGNAYRYAVFTDFNNDGYPDITAVNLFDKSIDFYSNNTRGRFTISRSVPLTSLPLNFNSTDIDLDYFEDIIWSEKNRINIIYGDVHSDYEESVSLTTKYTPHILVTGDFNKDGNIDIVYADTVAGSVSVFFSSGERQFFEEHLLLKKKNITSIVPYYSKFITGIAAYSSDGSVYMISNLQLLGDDVSLSAGIKPGVLIHFDYLNNGINDIAYIDEEGPTLNLIIRANTGIPELLYKYMLHYPHQEITTDNYSGEIKVFYCWSRGEKLIEVITADFGEGKLSRNSLYATEKIHDLKIKPVKGKPAVIYAAYIKEDKSAGANIFEFYDFRYTRVDYSAFAVDVEDITPYISNNEEGFYTWQKRGLLRLYYHNIRNLVDSKNLGELRIGESVVSFTADILNTGTPTQIAYIKGGNTFVTAGDKLNIIRSTGTPAIDNNYQFWAGEIRSGGLKRLFVYIPEKKSLQRVTLYNRGKDLILSELISGININRYFVKNMGVVDYHVIYSDSEENCITIKRIK
jgi:hypothetical protein